MGAAARAVAEFPPARRAAHVRLVAAQTAGAYLAWFDGRGAGWRLLVAPAGTAGPPTVVWHATGGVVCDVISPQRAGRRLLDAEMSRLVSAHLAAAGGGADRVAGCRLVTPLAPSASQLLDGSGGSGRRLCETAWWSASVRPAASADERDDEEVGA